MGGACGDKTDSLLNYQASESETKRQGRDGMTKRVILALIIGFAVAQLFRSIRNYNQRKDWTDIMGIIAALLMMVGAIGLFIAFFGPTTGE